MLTGSDSLPDLAVMEDSFEKQHITNVIAPEHDRMHHDHKNQLKNDEKMLVDQMISHFKKFKSDFNNAAQGDWVKSATSELKDISDNFKKIQDIEV